MNKKRLNTYHFNSARELNTQINGKCRSNSLLHHEETANKEYKNRISLSPLGELKLDLRDQIPTYHIRDKILKTNYLKEIDEIKAFDKANIESDINDQLKKHKYQLLLEKDLSINNRCKAKNIEYKSQFENRKIALKDQLTSIIKDSLLFAKKNSPVAAMLPPGVHEFFEKMKNENENNSLNSSRSRNNEIISENTKSNKKTKKNKNEFLSLIGVDVENLSINNVNIDIDKAWNYVLRLAKGRNVDEILRYKVVNSIMSLTEQKASEKVKKIYQKMDLYKEYKNREKREAMRKKREEERKRMEEIKKMDPRDLIKMKMRESLSQDKAFAKDGNTLTSRPKFRKKKKKELEVVKKEKIRYNAYDDVDKILAFIDNSKKNSQSKFCKDHFNNIQRTKTMDQKKNNLIYKNLIVEK